MKSTLLLLALFGGLVIAEANDYRVIRKELGTYEVTVNYLFELSRTTDRYAMFVAGGAAQTATQEVLDHQWEGAKTLTTNTGQQFLYVDRKGSFSAAQEPVTFKVKLYSQQLVRGTPQNPPTLSAEDWSRYTGATAMLDLQHPDVARQAAAIGSVLHPNLKATEQPASAQIAQVIRILDSLKSRQYYGASNWQPEHKRTSAVINGRGTNCGGASNYAAGLARYFGIPARTKSGYLLNLRGSLTYGNAIHEMAEFWINGVGWIQADPAQAFGRGYTGTLADPNAQPFLALHFGHFINFDISRYSAGFTGTTTQEVWQIPWLVRSGRGVNASLSSTNTLITVARAAE